MFLVVPSIDLSLMIIFAGQFINLTLLNARLSIFGSIVEACDYFFDFSSSLQWMPLFFMALLNWYKITEKAEKWQ
jgi:hypothetical protein